VVTINTCLILCADVYSFVADVIVTKIIKISCYFLYFYISGTIFLKGECAVTDMVREALFFVLMCTVMVSGFP
jgi:hypothetical protein